MKLVGYDEFIRMPAGTIFAPYKSCVLEDRLTIKVDHGRYNGRYGWTFNGVMPLEPWNVECAGRYDSTKATFEVYDGDNNDFADYDYFLILEDFDIDRLIKVLQWAKNGCPDEGYDAFDEI